MMRRGVRVLVVVDVTFHEEEDMEEPAICQPPVLPLCTSKTMEAGIRHLGVAEGQGDEEAGEEDPVLDAPDAAQPGLLLVEAGRGVGSGPGAGPTPDERCCLVGGHGLLVEERTAEETAGLFVGVTGRPVID